MGKVLLRCPNFRGRGGRGGGGESPLIWAMTKFKSLFMCVVPKESHVEVNIAISKSLSCRNGHLLLLMMILLLFNLNFLFTTKSYNSQTADWIEKCRTILECRNKHLSPDFNQDLKIWNMEKKIKV